jgi:hypothetical protein
MAEVVEGLGGRSTASSSPPPEASGPSPSPPRAETQRFDSVPAPARPRATTLSASAAEHIQGSTVRRRLRSIMVVSALGGLGIVAAVLLGQRSGPPSAATEPASDNLVLPSTPPTSRPPATAGPTSLPERPPSPAPAPEQQAAPDVNAALESTGTQTKALQNARRRPSPARSTSASSAHRKVTVAEDRAGSQRPVQAVLPPDGGTASTAGPKTGAPYQGVQRQIDTDSKLTPQLGAR